MVYDLTAQGHDFINSIRSDTVWHKTKQQINSLTIDAIKQVATKLIVQAVNIM